ncbi:transporter substrate-binding domain-containing protein [Brevibacterium sp. 5221]|uniref:Transporter substrate-binding domain-containing protein n=1 Tax=Brevibacterium rongguiense TaxID=2695267 RepID=A0A6N9H6E2_9MICO|nr:MULTISPECIES: transporter substrate-binding domain-containing protein [Brevibacterium]MYM19519.1 transporter substrate-binding domain-containing protein [Brevibacterium rongguiense]WAL39976.1 transporter substrate-binding domain-containing protein [Brevibacterium sp. BRM-1]
MKKFAAVGVTALALAAALTGCESSGGSGSVESDCKPKNEFKTIADGTLTVSVPELPPFTAYNNGQPQGVDIEVVNKIAQAECKTVKWMQTTYAGAIPAVTDGRADVATGAFYRTKERNEATNLTDPVYVDTMAAISKDGITKIPDMEKLKVGSVDGYLWVPDMKKVMSSNFTVYPSAVEMQQDLEAGRIQVGLDSFGSASDRLKDKKEYQVKTVEKDDRVKASIEAAQITFPQTKGNADMTKAFNEQLTQFHEDGTIKDILKQHGLPESSADTGKPRLIG